MGVSNKEDHGNRGSHGVETGGAGRRSMIADCCARKRTSHGAREKRRGRLATTKPGQSVGLRWGQLAKDSSRDFALRRLQSRFLLRGTSAGGAGGGVEAGMQRQQAAMPTETGKQT